MKKITADNAHQIGWFTAALLDKGLNVQPIMEDGVYTDTLDWRVKSVDGRFVTVHLTINPDVAQ